jgi:hypothetical protein
LSFHSPSRRTTTCAPAFAILAITVFVFASFAGGTRVALTPKFVPGESLVYEIESTTATAGKTVTPITNAEGATESSLTIGLRERLDVLSVDPRPDGDAVKFRLTFEAAQARATSDTLDPTSPDAAAPFAKLQGQSMEFTLASGGALSNFKGLQDVLPGGMPPPEAVAWISSLVASAAFSRGGIALGQRWSAERAIAGSPLTGLFWQTQSTYDRNETCPPLNSGAAGGKSATAAEPAQECAVILSQMTVARHGAAHSDQTPEDYLHNGLRTSGTWTGSGEELGSIDITTGLLMSATETSTQDMDYEITSASSGSSIQYTAKVQSQTGITLIDESQGTGGADH